MGHFRMCTGKVKFRTYELAAAEAFLQASHYPHFVWQWYECLWCDFSHIGRHGTAPGHSLACEKACSRKARTDREMRIIEGIW